MMRKNIKLLMLVTFILIICVIGFISVKIYNANKIKEYDSKAISAIINFSCSKENRDNYYDTIYELTDELKAYCNEECLETFILNRQIEYYISVFDRYGFVSVKDINLSIVSEQSSKIEKDKFTKEYEVKYTCVDENNKEHNFIDYFVIARAEGMINRVELKTSKSTTTKLFISE